MWKTVGLIIVLILSVVPGALIGAIIGAIYAPSKCWELLFGDSVTEAPEYVDEI